MGGGNGSTLLPREQQNTAFRMVSRHSGCGTSSYLGHACYSMCTMYIVSVALLLGSHCVALENIIFVILSPARKANEECNIIGTPL